MLGPHVIGNPNSLRQFMAQAQPQVIKYLDPPHDKTLPKAPLTIGRVHALSEQKDMSNPTALARQHADALASLADATGITLLEGINEPPVWNGAEYIKRLCAYELERARLLRVRGLDAVVLNLSVGWPRELPDGKIDWEPFRSLFVNLPAGAYLGLHEYWLPSGPLHEYSKYHRAGRLFRCPFNVPILVTECGVDIGGGQNDGWRARGVSVEAYNQQLDDYRKLLQSDKRVKSATIFTYGAPHGWASFDIEPDWAKFVAVCKPMALVWETPIRVETSTKIITLELEEYVVGVVAAEMFPTTWPAASGLGAAHPEGFKAAAILARTYGLWRIANPRSADIDIYGDARDQGYNPARVNDAIREAVTATRGVFIPGADGKALLRQYVNRCGRDVCPYCQGGGGFDGKTWSTRACQYGLQKMATQGKSWREILQHYYGEIKLSDGKETINMDCKTPFKDPMTDSFQMRDGKVIGCRVDIIKAEDAPGKPQTKPGDYVYRVVGLRFLNEEQARGDTRIKVQVLDRNGQAQMAKVINAWPQQRMPRWDGTAYDWASPGRWAEFAQGGGNYDPVKHGPLGPYVIYVEQGATGAAAVADWCIGFGLPGNRHVAYQVVYRECVVGETNDDKPSGCNLLLAALSNLIKLFK